MLSAAAASCAVIVVLLFSFTTADQPRFEVVPSGLAESGAGRVRGLERDASKESFVSRIFGTDCYTDALRAVRTECRNLDHEGKTRLALAFANCHLYKLGKRTYPCSESMTLKACVNHKDPEFYFAHMQFFSEVDSMCLFIQNQNFQRHTEFVLNLLYAAGSAAALRLVSLNDSMAAHASMLGGVSGQLDEVAQQQAHMATSVNASLASLDTLHSAASSLDTKLQRSLQQQDVLGDRQLEMLQGLSELEAQEQKVLAATSTLRELAQDGANEFLHQQRAQGALQTAMLADLRDVAASSKGVVTALQALAHYQHRSDAILVQLLGRSYGAADVLFYVAGGAAAAAAGAAPLTRSARLPLIGVFGGALLAERCLPPRLHSILQAGSRGELLLRVPVPEWLPAAPSGEFVVEFKWLLRKACLALGAAALVCAACTFRNVEKENLRCLERIEAHQRAQDKAQEALRRELRTGLLRERRALLAGMQALLDGAGGTAATTSPVQQLQVYTDEEGSDESVTSSTGGASASLSQPVSRRSLRMLDALPHSEQAPPLLHLQPAAASTTAAAAVAAAAAAAAPVSPASRRSVQHSKASSPAAARASHSMKHSREDCGPVTAAAASPASPGNSPTKRRRQDATAAAAAGNRKTSPGAAAKRSHQEDSETTESLAAGRRSAKRQHQ